MTTELYLDLEYLNSNAGYPDFDLDNFDFSLDDLDIDMEEANEAACNEEKEQIIENSCAYSVAPDNNVLQQQQFDHQPQQLTGELKHLLEKKINIKAAGVHITSIQIGKWKRDAKRGDEIVARFYYRKEKLAWELLNGGSKFKIEIEWPNIAAIKATLLPNRPGVLELTLHNKPLFHREIRENNIRWERSADFTDNQQASHVMKHVLEFAPGKLEKPYNDLITSLKILSSRSITSHSSPAPQTRPVKRVYSFADLISPEP